VRLSAPDLWIGLGIAALAAAYYVAALAIPDSMLSDEVGAGGLPKLLAAALAASGVLLAIRSQAGAPIRLKFNTEPRAIGLVVGMTAYIALLPLAGYPLVLAALVAGVALLAGAKPTIWLGVISVAAGIGFWLVFARLFHISVPSGILLSWI
jgi:putative tricarboxylic transport membrane protein